MTARTIEEIRAEIDRSNKQPQAFEQKDNKTVWPEGAVTLLDKKIEYVPTSITTVTSSNINTDIKEKKVVSDGGKTSYYELPEYAKELGDLIEFRNMNFNLGNIFKAVYRMGEKANVNDFYDLNKIIYFAEREKKRLMREHDLDENGKPKS